MKTKLNLALIPETKSNVVVSLSQTLSEIADAYVLGENSLPHVTLYQFEVEEDEIDNLWERVQATWEEEPLELKFERFSYKTFDQIIYWISLLPTEVHILNNMHAKVADIIEQPIIKSFEPHMTLINTKKNDCENEINKISAIYQPIRDRFILNLAHLQ